MFDSLLQFCRLQQVVSRIQHRIASTAKFLLKATRYGIPQHLFPPLSAYEKFTHKFHITPPWTSVQKKIESPEHVRNKEALLVALRFLSSYEKKETTRGGISFSFSLLLFLFWENALRTSAQNKEHSHSRAEPRQHTRSFPLPVLIFPDKKRRENGISHRVKDARKTTSFPTYFRIFLHFVRFFQSIFHICKMQKTQ